MRILFLDIDGVLNRTGYRPVQSIGLRSWLEPELARRLCEVLETTGAIVVLSSDWRVGRDMQELQQELGAGGLTCTLIGVTPVLGPPRWREIQAWMAEHEVPLENAVIVDDTFDMGPLSSRLVRTSPLSGLDDDAQRKIVSLFGERESA